MLSIPKREYICSSRDIPFEVALDTGSSDFWLVSDACQTSQCRGTPAYPLKKYASPTFTTVNDNQTAFNISFADTTGASGFVARETVQVGSMQSVGQALGLVTSSNVTLGQSVSGVLGLGFARLSRIAASVPSAPPFLSALAELGVLAYPIFGLSLTRGISGTLSMGAIDKSIVSDASLISWHDVVPFAPFPDENATATSLYLQWAIPLDNVTANGTAIELHPTYPNITGASPLALFDIGNNGIYGPFQDVAAMFLALGTIRQVSAGAWALPCNTKSTMTFSFAGTNVTLQPQDYLIGPTRGDPTLCLSWPMALPPSSDGLDWHLGTPFFRAVYTVFSFGISGHEPPLIGLYPLFNTTLLTDTPESLASLFSSLSATVATTVPPVLLPTPSFSTPPYAFDTTQTPLPTRGQISPSQSDLGAATYSPLFSQAGGASGTGLATLVMPATQSVNANESATPAQTLLALDAPTTLATLVTTDSAGLVHTTTSTASTIPTAFLGKPGGLSSGATPRTGRVKDLWGAWGVSHGGWTLCLCGVMGMGLWNGFG
ncbi:aspartic peptidase domain-containing protein [Gautieria morchelliformis]|nr:aspartic peptidase domain-containing protein [Gautieria morchelliformis]